LGDYTEGMSQNLVSKSRQRCGVVSISLASGRNFRHFSLGDVGRVRNSVLALYSHNGHRRRLRIDSFSVSFWVQGRKSLDHDHAEARETRERQELCLRSSAERTIETKNRKDLPFRRRC